MSKIDWSDVEYFKGARNRAKPPYISLTRSGTIILNRTFISKEKITHTHVVLGFSRKNNAIIFKFLSDKDAVGAVKVSNRKSSPAIISAISFLRQYNIDIQKYARQYEPKLETFSKNEKYWVIYLKEMKK